MSSSIRRSKIPILAATFQGEVAAVRKESANSISSAFAALKTYERLAGEVYALRYSARASADERYLAEDTLTAVTQELLLNVSTPRTERLEVSWRSRYRRVWRENINLFWYATFLFLVNSLIGWAFTVQYPEYAAVLVPQDMAEAVLERDQWFTKAQSAPLLFGLGIAVNNIKVALNAFALGAVFGIGGLAILCFNGLHLGSILGFCHAHGFFEPLQIFILSHGPLELTIIVAAAFASLLYGRAFFMRPLRQFPKHLAAGAEDAFVVLLGTVPWLIVAAIMEAFVSPVPSIPTGAKFAFGVILAATFWTWTFWPPRSHHAARE